MSGGTRPSQPLAQPTPSQPAAWCDSYTPSHEQKLESVKELGKLFGLMQKESRSHCDTPFHNLALLFVQSKGYQTPCEASHAEGS